MPNGRGEGFSRDGTCCRAEAIDAVRELTSVGQPYWPRLAAQALRIIQNIQKTPVGSKVCMEALASRHERLRASPFLSWRYCTEHAKFAWRAACISM